MQTSERPGTYLAGLRSTLRGDVVAYTDLALNLRVAKAFAYEEYGTISHESTLQANTALPAGVLDALESAQPLRYAGYVYDSYSGLYYCSQRYLDPQSCQWISADPALADGEESAYQYCGGDPVNGVDPSGLRSDAGGGGGFIGTQKQWVKFIGLYAKTHNYKKAHREATGHELAKVVSKAGGERRQVPPVTSGWSPNFDMDAFTNGVTDNFRLPRWQDLALSGAMQMIPGYSGYQAVAGIAGVAQAAWDLGEGIAGVYMGGTSASEASYKMGNGGLQTVRTLIEILVAGRLLRAVDAGGPGESVIDWSEAPRGSAPKFSSPDSIRTGISKGGTPLGGTLR